MKQASRPVRSAQWAHIQTGRVVSTALCVPREGTRVVQGVPSVLLALLGRLRTQEHSPAHLVHLALTLIKLEPPAAFSVLPEHIVQVPKCSHVYLASRARSRVLRASPLAKNARVAHIPTSMVLPTARIARRAPLARKARQNAASARRAPTRLVAGARARGVLRVHLGDSQRCPVRQRARPVLPARIRPR